MSESLLHPEPPEDAGLSENEKLPQDVRPACWQFSPFKMVLFDDWDYSVVTGKYVAMDGTEHPHSLGERWNRSGRTRRGFPLTSGHHAWFVVPDYLEVPILHGLLDELARDPANQRAEEGEDHEHNIAAGTEVAEVRRQRILRLLGVMLGV